MILMIIHDNFECDYKISSAFQHLPPNMVAKSPKNSASSQHFLRTVRRKPTCSPNFGMENPNPSGPIPHLQSPPFCWGHRPIVRQRLRQGRLWSSQGGQGPSPRRGLGPGGAWRQVEQRRQYVPRARWGHGGLGDGGWGEGTAYTYLYNIYIYIIYVIYINI